MATLKEKENMKDSVHMLLVGAPLLDITAHCGQEILVQYKMKSDDCIEATVEHQELFRSLFSNPESQYFAGGSSQNTARIAKWTLGDKGNISFVGCVGEDDFAERMLQCLQSEGVEPLYVPLPGEFTGICACLLNSKGERSMCSRLGAAAIIRQHHLNAASIPQRLKQANCVFVEGYFFAHSPDVVLFLAQNCRKDQIFSLSLSAEYICRDYAHAILEVLPSVDVLFSNETEAKAMTKALGLPEETTVEEIACTLATKNRLPPSKPRIVVVTRGPNPVLLVNGANHPSTFPIPTGIRVLDSVGCGDAIAGAFLAVYTLTGDICKALKTGIAAAVEIAQVGGCNPTQKVLYPLEEDICDIK